MFVFRQKKEEGIGAGWVPGQMPCKEGLLAVLDDDPGLELEELAHGEGAGAVGRHRLPVEPAGLGVRQDLLFGHAVLHHVGGDVVQDVLDRGDQGGQRRRGHLEDDIDAEGHGVLGIGAEEPLQEVAFQGGLHDRELRLQEGGEGDLLVELLLEKLGNVADELAEDLAGLALGDLLQERFDILQRLPDPLAHRLQIYCLHE